MTRIQLLDHNLNDAHLTFTYKRTLLMARRDDNRLRLAAYMPVSKRWVAIPLFGPAGRALREHLAEHRIHL